MDVLANMSGAEIARIVADYQRLKQRNSDICRQYQADHNEEQKEYRRKYYKIYRAANKAKKLENKLNLLAQAAVVCETAAAAAKPYLINVMDPIAADTITLRNDANAAINFAIVNNIPNKKRLQPLTTSVKNLR